jgi:hypothetical protein
VEHDDEGSEREERRAVGFRVVHVWERSQIEGEPRPEVAPVIVEGELPERWGFAPD